MKKNVFFCCYLWLCRFIFLLLLSHNFGVIHGYKSAFVCGQCRAIRTFLSRTTQRADLFFIAVWKHIPLCVLKIVFYHVLCSFKQLSWIGWVRSCQWICWYVKSAAFGLSVRGEPPTKSSPVSMSVHLFSSDYFMPTLEDCTCTCIEINSSKCDNHHLGKDKSTGDE